jgi:TIR domain
MRVIEKISLLDRIGRELQSRMGYSDINVYLTAYGVDCKDYQPSTNSKWVYVKELLANADENLLIQIADDLEIDHNFSRATPKEATVWKAGQFKLFLSHLASFKAQTAKLQQKLRKYAISSFVAHEDIEPSKEWQIEIEAALHTMDAMAVLLMPGFKESNWCDQEIGVAIGRDVLIIPVRKGLDPYGFIGKYQGIQAVNKSVGEVAKEIFEVIIKSPKTRGKIIGSLANTISQSTHDEDATEKVLLLQSISNIPKDVLESMKTTIAENNVLINSKQFIDELNKLFITYSIDKLSVGGVAVQPEWDDDIPF